MSYNFFRPKAGRFGIAPVLVNSGQIGGTNFLGGTSPLTVNNTTIFRLGNVAGRKVQFSSLGASAVTVPADADGSILAYAYKYDASADAAVALTGPLNLEALVTREGSSVPALATASDADLTFDVGDTLEIHVVNNSAAIDTQPAGLVFSAELLVLE